MDYQCQNQEESYDYIKGKATAVIAACQKIIGACEEQKQEKVESAIHELMANSARVSMGFTAMNYFPEKVRFTIKE